MSRTIGEWLDFFRKNGADLRELTWLLAEVEGLAKNVIWDPRSKIEFSQEQEEWFCKRAKRLLLGEPLAYILGFVEFLSCRIELSPQVLIPRQETEILVEQVCAYLDQQTVSGRVLWDVCCGSGCIAIAIKKRFPLLHVVASDLSRDALLLAQKNANANGVDVEFRYGDLLIPFEGEVADDIVSNPPYLTYAEYQQLDASVKNFEPKHALLGGVQGVAFYERFAEEAHRFLIPQGRLWMEIGSTQGLLVQQLFASPPWCRSRLQQDWAGRDRFFSVERE